MERTTMQRAKRYKPSNQVTEYPSRAQGENEIRRRNEYDTALQLSKQQGPLTGRKTE
jgi:hypothetical protein